MRKQSWLYPSSHSQELTSLGVVPVKEIRSFIEKLVSEYSVSSCVYSLDDGTILVRFVAGDSIMELGFPVNGSKDLFYRNGNGLVIINEHDVLDAKIYEFMRVLSCVTV